MRKLLLLGTILFVTWTMLLVACSPAGGETGSGTVALSSATANVPEGDSVMLSVGRSGGSEGGASVDWETADGSAQSGADFVSDSGTLTWSDGESGSKSITVATTDDATVEGAEAFSVTLSNAVGAAMGSPNAVTVTIQDDDVSPGAPTVDSTNPAAGATGTGLNAVIVVRFSEAMNQAATEAAFSASPTIACAFSWNASGDTLSCNPQSDLAASTSYTITIGAGAEDIGGDALAAAASFSFTTGTTTLSACAFDAAGSTFGNCTFGS